MATTHYDVAILGSGPVGCALALGLARHAPDPSRIALMGPRPAAGATGHTLDPRALALNQGSRQWLEQLGAWPAESADILTVHVSQAGHLGRTLIDHGELDTPRLGSVVAYDTLVRTLETAATQCGITRLIERPSRPHPGQPVHLTLPDGVADAALVLLSDGERPQGITRNYSQQAVLATVRASSAQPGHAFERFTRTGPLALLPHPTAAGHYNTVWCVPPARAQALATLPDEDFTGELQTAFGTTLGTLDCVSPRHTFPLSLHAGPSVLGAGLAAVGNAAQTLHPVAGQGLNLGLRDVAQLAHMLTPWLARPQRPVQILLERYARQRRLDRGLTLFVTDSLPRVFATDNPVQRHACGLALLALDALPFLRKPLARQLMRGQRL